VLMDTFTPSPPGQYSYLPYSGTADAVFSTQDFKAEFDWYTHIAWASGPRIVELDGFNTPRVPEPTTMLLLGLGLIGLAGARRKFKQ
jgi:hypothetical protein